VIEWMCRPCGVTFVQFNPLQTICGKCAYNKYASPRKPIKRMGTVAKQWAATRRTWIQANGTVTGTWVCYLCDKPLTIDNLTLDHVQSRSRHPELRSEPDNLAACCYSCNTHKGSRNENEL